MSPMQAIPKKHLFLIKEDGTQEEFEVGKLFNSLTRSGASQSHANEIVSKVEQRISREVGGTARATEVYKYAFSELRKMSIAAAARYSLRRSMLELGPTGFPFESYIAEIFKSQGYKTATDQVVMGSCVPHEVDVVAWNDKKLIMAEVKYHNDTAGKSDLKVSLYVKARYDDLKGIMFDYGAPKGRPLDEGWLITNTKFTETALKYGECAGLNMLSWNFPETGNLQDLIESAKLHPVTCLTTLSSVEKRQLLEKGLVLCRDLHDTAVLKKQGFSEAKIFKVLEEVSIVLNDTE